MSTRLAPPAWWALGGLCLASIVIVVVLGTRLTFFNDDWYFLLQRPGLASRPGLDEFLAPHNGHLELFPAIAYKLLVAVFGLDTQLPFRLVLGLAIAAVGVAVYALVVSRSGDLLALCAAAIVVLLGPAWEDMLMFNSISIVGSLAFGLAALWVLQEDARRRNAVACALLVGAVCMSNAGLLTVLMVARVVRRGRPPSYTLVVASAALVFWVLTGSSFAPGREAFASRYQLLDAALILVVCATFFAGLRPSRVTAAALVVVAALSVASNLDTLVSAGYPFMRTQSAFAKVDLGALQIAGPRAAPNTWLIEPVARNPFLGGITPAGRAADVAFIDAHSTTRAHVPGDAVARPWSVGVRALRGAPVDARICVG